MKRALRERYGSASLAAKIKAILVVTLIPMLILCATLLGAFVKYSNEYDRMIESLTIASEFSNEFQRNVDYNTYQYVVQNRDALAQDAHRDVRQAGEIVSRLTASTIHEENFSRLQTIERSLGLLTKNIETLRGGGDYNFKMDWMDKRIWRLTGLIKSQMQEYIYYETLSLAMIRQQLRVEIRQVSLTVGALLAVLVLALFIMAIRVSSSIAKPIRALSENIRAVGEGDFTLRPVSSESNEVQALSETFEGMVERIRVLMDNIRADRDNLRMAEYRLLQAQINPHFLYNTLDTVIWLAEDKQNDKVIQLISSLSTFFRSSLSNGRDVITIREEEAHVRSYLEIQQMRYQDILTYEIDIEQELYRYTIPKLTLQPLVENALYHGVKNKRGMGRIAIRGKRDSGGIRFTVVDDGIGMDSAALYALRDSLGGGEEKSFGLTNVYRRLHLYYEESRIEIDSEYGIGTTVTIRIPARGQEPAGEGVT